MLTNVRWLGLDVGRVRVGAAVGDSSCSAATALPPIPFKGADLLARTIADLVDTWAAEGVVVGVPKTRSGCGKGERRVAAVVAALRQALTVPVATEDETGTTAAAEIRMREGGVPVRRRDSLRDSVAAQLILESFLAGMYGQCREDRGVDQDGDE